MDRFSRFFIPNLICDSIFDLPKKYTGGKKIRAIIFDIDNTLAPYDQEEPDEKTVAFLKGLEEKGIRIVLVSNNSPERVAKFNQKLGFFCVPDAGKPKKAALKPALEHLSGIKRKRILFVGDQLLTDADERDGVQVLLVTHLYAAKVETHHGWVVTTGLFHIAAAILPFPSQTVERVVLMAYHVAALLQADQSVYQHLAHLGTQTSTKQQGAPG